MNAYKISLADQINKPLLTDNSDEFIVNILKGVIKNGDRKGTQMSYVHYKPAELKNTGSKFFIQYSIRHPSTGKWVRIKRYGIGENMGLNRIKNLHERIKVGGELAEAFNIALSHGYNPFQKKEGPKSWTMFQALNLWKINTENKADRKATVYAYTSMVNTYLKKFQKVHYDLLEITRADLETFLANLKKSANLTGTTYNSYLRNTKVFFNYCVVNNMLSKSPAQGMKPVKAVVQRHKYFTDEEFQKIKEKATPQLFDFMEFLYFTALRPKEARYIKYKDVQGDRLFVSGSFSKNKKDEFIPLSVDYAKKLQGEPEHYIFGGRKMKGPNFYGRLFSDLKKHLKLDEDHTLYGVKHTRANHLVRDKVDPYSISKLFRHSSLEITMKYIRELGLELNREAADKGRSF